MSENKINDVHGVTEKYKNDSGVTTKDDKPSLKECAADNLGISGIRHVLGKTSGIRKYVKAPASLHSRRKIM